MSTENWPEGRVTQMLHEDPFTVCACISVGSNEGNEGISPAMWIPIVHPDADDTSAPGEPNVAVGYLDLDPKVYPSDAASYRAMRDAAESVVQKIDNLMIHDEAAMAAANALPMAESMDQAAMEALADELMLSLLTTTASGALLLHPKEGVDPKVQGVVFYTREGESVAVLSLRAAATDGQRDVVLSVFDWLDHAWKQRAAAALVPE